MDDAARPKKFILIDNSISGFAGHYYEYAVHVLRAARDSGYRCYLATNLAFSGENEEETEWRIIPAYHYKFWTLLPPPQWPRFLRAMGAAYSRLRFWSVFRRRFSTWGIGLQLRHNIGGYFATPPWGLGRLVEAAFLLPFAIAAKILRLVLLPVAALIWVLLRIPAIVRLVANTRWTRPISEPLYNLVAGEASGLKRMLTMLVSSRIAVLQFIKQLVCTHRFAKDSAALFERLDVGPDDVVFVPTASGVEMMGIGKFLARHPQACQPSWHVLYRRDLYRGRVADYGRQEEKQQDLRRTFRAFEKVVQGRARIYYYTDTEELTAQYNRLGVGLFSTVPIPHTHEPPPATRRDGPLRVTYVGDSRTEKGYAWLPHLILDLAGDYAGKDALEFAVQSNFNIPGGEPACVVARSQLNGCPRDMVQVFDHPLSSSAYREHLLSGDLSLLMYDRENYYARSSGVLIECLSAGIPVLAPAGTWLARQFLAQHYRHLRSLGQTLPVVGMVKPEQTRWRRSPETAGFASSRIPVPAGARWFLFDIAFDSSVHLEAMFLVEPIDEGLDPIGRPAPAVMESEPGGSGAVLMRAIHREATALRLVVSGTARGAAFRLPAITITFLGAVEPDPPLSAVGLIYQSRWEIPHLIRDFVKHHDHYAATARRFSHAFREYHNAGRLIAEIEARVAAQRAPQAAGGAFWATTNS
jgi:hypothetical protein